MIQVAVMGYGTVGSGVVEVIEKNKEEINKKSGEEINIKYILDLRDFPGDPYADKVVHDVELILNDPEIMIICETMGGLKPAYDFTKRALQAGKASALPIKSWWQCMARSLLELPMKINVIICLRPVLAEVFLLSAR